MGLEDLSPGTRAMTPVGGGRIAGSGQFLVSASLAAPAVLHPVRSVSVAGARRLEFYSPGGRFPRSSSSKLSPAHSLHPSRADAARTPTARPPIGGFSLILQRDDSRRQGRLIGNVDMGAAGADCGLCADPPFVELVFAEDQAGEACLGLPCPGVYNYPRTLTLWPSHSQHDREYFGPFWSSPVPWFVYTPMSVHSASEMSIRTDSLGYICSADAKVGT